MSDLRVFTLVCLSYILKLIASLTCFQKCNWIKHYILFTLLMSCTRHMPVAFLPKPWRRKLTMPRGARWSWHMWPAPFDPAYVDKRRSSDRWTNHHPCWLLAGHGSLINRYWPVFHIIPYEYIWIMANHQWFMNKREQSVTTELMSRLDHCWPWCFY